MHLIVISACTGVKKYNPENQLTQAGFRRIHDKAEFSLLEENLAEYRLPAEEMYEGQQHRRLMEGVRAFRNSFGEETLDLQILSAGYGFIPGNRPIVPYEVTFQGMKSKDLEQWANHLKIPAEGRKLFSMKADLVLVLLGAPYLKALQLDESVFYSAPTVFLTSEGSAKYVKGQGPATILQLEKQHARTFSCGLVGLKGEIAKRLLQKLAETLSFLDLIQDSKRDLLAELEGNGSGTNSNQKKPLPKNKKKCIIKNDVDYVVSIPQEWWKKAHRKDMRYFIPEWDDLVDRDYDFETDTHSGGRGDWLNEVYAHQMYPTPNYDGILISKVVAEKKASKRELINKLGVHRYLRLPETFPIMGDCGAFGYVNEEYPPYSTDEILDYYTRLGFDYGVSIDHMIVKATKPQWKERYEITIQNAADFIKAHKKAGLHWTPVGAVQGWDPKSYVFAVKEYVKMGYKYLGMGGLARTNTKQILAILEEVHPYLPQDVGLHLFGVARLKALDEFKKYGVRSVDSASYLRRAWLGSGQNYFTLDGEKYSAIRIPEGGKSFRAKRMVTEGRASEERALELEKRSLNTLRDYDKGLVSLETTLDILEEYDVLIGQERIFERDKFERVLQKKPWKECACPICQKDGIEVIIFRGNNRNRRRGFHNTYVFYQLFQDILNGDLAFQKQLSLGLAPSFLMEEDPDEIDE